MEEILAIAKDWSYWSKAPAKSIARDVVLPTQLSPKVALVIQGVRRCGKSTLMAQLMNRYKLNRKRCLFLNFEDPRLVNALNVKTLQAMVHAFEKQAGADVVYFLDEIQLVDGWQKWLRSHLDRPGKRRFVVSGSNARLLSGELGATLTGRHLTVELFPFSLEEFLRTRPGAKLVDFLHMGGFPEAVMSPDADLLLRQYFLDIIERDMRERVGARSSTPLRQLVQMVYESAGSEMSLRRAAAALGIAVDTAGVYMAAAESAYLFFGCPYFDWSERKRAARNAKYYPIDTALRRIAITRAGADRGKMLECATYLWLRQQSGAIYYWRGRGEVDFVVEKEGDLTPVQVSWEGPAERHHRALDEFYAAHPRSREAIFVTANSFAKLSL